MTIARVPPPPAGADQPSTARPTFAPLGPNDPTDGPDLPDGPVLRAARSAIAVGTAGLLALCALFLFGDPASTHTDSGGLLTIALALLLLAATGGYGLLAFYGARLRRLWSRRHQPERSAGDRLAPLRLALGDLRKIRWLSAAVLLVILPVYLAPSRAPSYFGLEAPNDPLARMHGMYQFTPHSPANGPLTQLAVLAWVGLAAVPVLAARRAAWEIAAARGELAGAADLPAFPVLALPVPRAADGPTAVARPPHGEPAVPVAAVPIAAVPFATAPSPADRPDVGGHRDWEAVLLASLVLLMADGVVWLDASRDAWRLAGEPTAWATVYNQLASPTGGVTPAGDSLSGLAGVACVAATAALWFAHAAAVGWAATCLMAGPRFRRLAVALAAAVLAVMAAQMAAALTLAHRIGADSVGRVVRSLYSSFGLRADAAIEPGGFLLRGLAFVVLLVVLTRPPVRELFDRRVRRRRRRRASGR